MNVGTVKYPVQLSIGLRNKKVLVYYFPEKILLGLVVENQQVKKSPLENI